MYKYGDSVKFNNDGCHDWRTGTVVGRSMENGTGPFLWLELFDKSRVMVLESSVVAWDAHAHAQQCKTAKSWVVFSHNSDGTPFNTFDNEKQARAYAAERARYARVAIIPLYDVVC